jgi:uncharacterized protein YtpQ (UPF0354 family)
VTSAADAPEHDWSAAASRLMPVLRPAGTRGASMSAMDAAQLAAEAMKRHTLPLIDEGPAGLAVAYAIRAEGFDVLVSADHLLAWSVPVERVRETAMANLAAWSEVAAWVDELSGGRRVLSSDTGDGPDAARILLPAVRQHLASAFGEGVRVVVGLPDRHLLLATPLAADDPEFAGLLAAFIRDHADAADEPVHAELFELVDGELVAFAG